jgi:hypothetical protein
MQCGVKEVQPLWAARCCARCCERSICCRCSSALHSSHIIMLCMGLMLLNQ